MVTTQMKTDAQRLGNGKKAFNVKQVEKMVEDAGGGTEYIAGDGISISAENEISVDTTTIQEKLTAGNGIAIDDNVISALGEEWKIVEPSKWFDCIGQQPAEPDYGIAKYDMILCIKLISGDKYSLFFKKGCVVPDISLRQNLNKIYSRFQNNVIFGSNNYMTPRDYGETFISESNGIITINYGYESNGSYVTRVRTYDDYNNYSARALLFTKEDVE